VLLLCGPAAGTVGSATAARLPRVDGRGRMVGHREHSRNGYDRAVTSTRTRALELVTRAGVAHRVHSYDSPERHGRERDERPTYGADAASALGVEPARIFKTLAAMVDERLVLAVVPVDRELDPKRLAEVWGGRRAVLAQPAAAERATGSVIGGISPLGSRRALPVVVDASALDFETIFVSAGRRGLQLELAPADLVRLSSARSAPIARDHGPG
jgi:Cys-tRNA(Pro)/Cys-tRNA(Cys) deacylase